jgi:hypothetical protein
MQVAQRIAAWLIARPLHTVLGLALTLLLPFAQILSGAVMTMAVLQQGWRMSVLQGLAAAGLVAVMAAITNAPVVTILVNALVFWLPASLVALLVRQNRSLTLAYQVTAILALLGALALYVLLPDQVQFWKQTLSEVAVAFKEMGFDQQAELLITQQDVIAPQMTVLFVLTTWSLVSLVLALGYGLYQRLPEKNGRYGRFCDLDFGRVLAMVMAVASLLALLTDGDWAQGVAFVAFVIFWIQGLALLHWMYTEGPLPLALLFVVYAMLPVLNALLVMGLAVVGYTDAWFDFRSRMKERNAQ